MSPFGVITEGFNAKDIDDVLDEMEQAQRAALGPAINTQADSVLGQINGIVADKIAELWEVALAVYRSRQPSSASGEALDNVGDITGALRLAASPSTVSLSLNLDAAATVPIGSVASIGPSGARWVTTEAGTNVTGDGATVAVTAESEDSAPIVGNAYAIDTIAVPVSGWSAKAAVNNLTSEPYPLADLQTLLVQVDEGSTQTVIFNTGDFADITLATAQEVLDAIKADTTGLDGEDATGFVRLVSDLDGSGSAIRIVGGTAFEALGFSQELIKGFNPNRAAKIINSINETYDLSTLVTLFVSVDQAAFQTVTFVDDDFGLPAIGNLQAIAASLLAVGADTDTFDLDDGVNPVVTFAFDDDSSVVETPTLRAINHNGTQNAAQMRTLIESAINAAPTLDITASLGPNNTIVDLTNDANGVAGNVAIVETVANAGFTVVGMAGGVANTPAAATAVQVARAITAGLSGAAAYVVAGKVQIESLTVGVNSFIEVTGGASNAILGYTEGDEQGGTAGDADLGRNVELDAEFRIRREQLLRISGSATLEAIRAAVRNVANVVQAFVFENPTDVIDGFGRPPHSFEVVVAGGDDTDIAQVIFDTKPIGIQSFKVPGPSGVTIVITDSQTIDHDINFSRATEIQMHVELDIDVVAADFGGGNQVSGEQQVRQAIKDIGDALEIGEDVIIQRFRCAPFDVTGVVDVTAMDIEDTDPPSNVLNIVIADRDLATFSTADIDINVSFV